MRPGTEADALQGVVPRQVHEPSSVEEAEALLGQLARERQHLAFIGGGTQLGLGAPPRRLDAVVRTHQLSRIVEYAPSDQVVTVEAGVTLAALQRELQAHRQRLALDPPLPERATLGGLVAANTFGPLRARYGAVRDLLLGVCLVRADGVRARGGGKVVKNVAGFDLPKLMCGSLGTLGLIATATFRVHPLPEARATLLARGVAPAGVQDLLRRVREAQLEPCAVVATRVAPGRYDAAVRFEGFAAGVSQQEARLRALAPIEPLPAPDAAALWAAHDTLRAGGALRLKLAALPTALARVEEAAAPLLATLPGAQLAWYPTLGLGFLSAPHAGGAEVAGPIEALRQALGALGGSLVIEAAPAAVRERLDPWGPAPASLRLHRAIKERFDPEGRLAPGRFAGGL